MPRRPGQQTGKDLNAKQIAALKNPGLYRVSECLYVQVTERGSKSWICRVRYNRSYHDIGLGSATSVVNPVSLLDAKAKTLDIRRKIAAGGDPLAGRTPRSVGAASILPAHQFREVAEDYITKNQAGWKGKTARIWRAMLTQYAYPAIGDLAMDQITVGHIEQILHPIWTIRHTTADAVRDRIRRVWDAARVRGWCSGQNPAQWAATYPPCCRHPGRFIGSPRTHLCPIPSYRL